MARYTHMVIISILFYFLFYFHSVAQQIIPRFEHITSKDGLPENSVRVITQDHQGYLWFGTQNGLVKYDGYAMKMYRHDENDSTTISNNQIFSIFEDKAGNLWVGTGENEKGGLNKLDRSTDKFIRYLHNQDDSTTINSNNIDCIYEDHLGNLWIGTNIGLNRFNQEKNNFERFNYWDKKFNDAVYNFINKLRNSGKTLQSILKVGNNARIRKTYTLTRKTPVLIVAMTEGISDYGWLEDNKGNVLFEPKMSESFLGGKNIRHRIQIWYDTLNPGIYNLNYVSDWYHSYNDWQNISHLDFKAAGPDHPENWGIQAFDAGELNIDVTDITNNYSFVPIEIRIFNIIEDHTTDCLLLGSSYPGIVSFNIKTKTFQKSFAEKIGLASSFHRAHDKSIWIASNQGISRYIPEQDSTILIQPIPSKLHLKENHFESIIEDKDGIIWAGSVYEGLISYNPQTNKFIRNLADIDDEFSLSSNRVFSIFEDRSEILWIGTWAMGLNKFNKYKWVFKHYNKSQNISNTLSNNSVSSIYADDDFIWLGTNGTLVKYDMSKRSYTNISFTSKTKSNNPVTSIIRDSYNNLWFGIINVGLVKFDIKSQESQIYSHNPLKINSLSNNYVSSVLEDKDGKLWIGTAGGLNIFDPKTEVFERLQLVQRDTCSLPQNEVRVIFEDSSFDIWVGTNLGGFVKYDRERKCFYKILSRDYSVQSCIEDNDGKLWVGTHMKGIFCFNKNDNSLVNYTTKNRLTSNETRAVLQDDYGNIWISTTVGLSRINTKNNTIKNITVDNGLPFSEYYYKSAAKSNDGELFFGGVNDGFISFFPENVKDNPVPPEVVISNISLFNQPESDSNIKKYFAQTDTLEFNHFQNDLRFDFAAIHFNNPAKNKYKYMLENFDEHWIDAGIQRNAVYTNLDPGEYVFRVSASNSDGIWNEKGASVRILILPPWWATTWAYIIYALIIFSIIYITWRLQLKRIRIKNDYEMSKFEADKMHEVDELKSRFFANISHEFRTPLTLIFGPAKDVLEKTQEPDTKKNVGLIKRNATRLYGLVNQLLDLSKLEAGKMKLELSEQNIIPLLKGLFLSFTSLAERKKITLKFNTIEKNLNVYIDKDKLEKILNNLLSNAFKFTSVGGKIDITVEKLIKNVEIRIADNGIGITKERLDKIFDRFYQVDGSHTRESEGTGIGLALTKELVELHKGKISVESKEGEGTTFTVQLPLDKVHLKPEEIIENNIQEKTSGVREEVELVPEIVDRKEKTEIDLLLETDKPLLLIVEDNSDVRNYIISHLEKDYRIQEAIDGEDGLENALSHIPDLIISDVMMPNLDGYQLCEKIKTNERTSHIPIILLTAKASGQDKIEGLETGADDYIIKPFDAAELKVRIKNLIELRRNLQEKFSSDNYRVPKEFRSIDEQFMKNILKLINEHISEEEFSIEGLSQEAAMSRKHLHRKLKALTGKSPSQFLRSIRLSKAMSLIKEGNGTISEISFMVGFSSPVYFNRCFKEEFGCSPSEVAR